MHQAVKLTPDQADADAFVARLASLSRVPLPTRQPVELLPAQLAADAARVCRLKECYNNVLKLMPGCGREARYVVGWWLRYIPIEHCWLKLGDRYFDPTWQTLLRQGDEPPGLYYPVAELTLKEVFAHMERADGWLPELYQVARHLRASTAKEAVCPSSSPP